jgi:hypothetical protein
MPHTKNPSLPSIQFLLNDDKDITTEPVTNNTIRRHHRQSHSISSLPSELQQLSLSGPSSNDIPTHNNPLPSWMVGNTTTTLLPPLSSTHETSKKSPGASSNHTRSFSDFTLAHPLHNTTPPVINPTRERHQTHRRTVSANNSSIDFYQSTHDLPFINERARTTSPPPAPVLSNSHHLLSDALNIKSKLEDNKPVIERDEQTGKYFCPYCKKPFNRPSSLRIHTYSHTGEKPFVCSEEGCGRQFSVQSNMRRHLRVHKLGRSSKNSTK